MTPGLRARLFQLGAAAAAMLFGLVWRLVPLGLPPWAVKDGGSALWGAMVLLIVGAMVPARWPAWVVLGLALLVAVGSELFRLFHTPTLDAFRLTLPGALLLGRIFNPWNVMAYAVGMGVALPLRATLKSGLRSGERR